MEPFQANAVRVRTAPNHDQLTKQTSFGNTEIDGFVQAVADVDQ